MCWGNVAGGPDFVFAHRHFSEGNVERHADFPSPRLQVQRVDLMVMPQEVVSLRIANASNS